MTNIVNTIINSAIEQMEKDAEAIDGEWGCCRDFDELKADGDIPPALFAMYELRKMLADKTDADLGLELILTRKEELPYFLPVVKGKSNEEIDAVINEILAKAGITSE